MRVETDEYDWQLISDMIFTAGEDMFAAGLIKKKDSPIPVSYFSRYAVTGQAEDITFAEESKLVEGVEAHAMMSAEIH